MPRPSSKDRFAKRAGESDVWTELRGESRRAEGSAEEPEAEVERAEGPQVRGGRCGARGPRGREGGAGGLASTEGLEWPAAPPRRPVAQQSRTVREPAGGRGAQLVPSQAMAGQRRKGQGGAAGGRSPVPGWSLLHLMLRRSWGGRRGLAEDLTEGPSFLPSPLLLRLSLCPHSQRERRSRRHRGCHGVLVGVVLPPLPGAPSPCLPLGPDSHRGRGLSPASSLRTAAPGSPPVLHGQSAPPAAKAQPLPGGPGPRGAAV